MSNNRFIKLGLACAGGVLPVLAATPASAEECTACGPDAQCVPCAEPEPVYVPPPVVVEDDDDIEEISLSVGGGAQGFTDSDAYDMLEVGGSWDVRANFGTRSYLGVEAAYIGSAQGVDSFGVEDDAVLVGNGAEAALRFNMLPDMNVQPYLIAGAAWRRYDLTETDLDTNLSPISGTDDVFEVPMGGGVAWYIDDVVIDARAQFRASFDNDLVEELDGDTDDNLLHRWGVSANVGYEF
jgi:hypothetical protein